jgi:hypothetical protein
MFEIELLDRGGGGIRIRIHPRSGRRERRS